MPKVSILLPNLNTRRFLAERIDSILAQTFQDWEVVVVDGFSTDGAWELIQEYAAREPRMRLFQSPPEGIYVAWNECIGHATGDYVYIATSDDTMEPDCIARLAAALDAHPECGLAHCCLTYIDEESRPIKGGPWDYWASVRYFGGLMKREHTRPPGHDAILACAIKTPYASITELLIRRSLFERAGLFETRWGSFCDLEWQMRATLVTSTVHVPEYLATWRIHSGQASQKERFLAAVRDGWLLEMFDSAVRFSRRVGMPVAEGLPRRLRRFYEAEQFHERFHILGYPAKLKLLSATVAKEPQALGFLVRDRQRRRRYGDHFEDIRRELALLGIPDPVAT